MFLERKEVAKRVAEFFSENIHFFCIGPPSTKEMLDRFAPNGFQKTDGSIPKPGLPFLIESTVTMSLKIQEPVDGVVWWKKPKGEGRTDELHLVLNANYRVLPYDDFIKTINLTPGIARPQAHPLGDIQFEHKLSAPDIPHMTIVINKIVWAGDVIGKIGEVALLWK